MKYLWRVLLSLAFILSYVQCWAQHANVMLDDLLFVIEDADISRPEVLHAMQGFYDTHQVRLSITLLAEDDPYQAFVTAQQTKWLGQSAPGIAITTWHSPSSKAYQRFSVQVNEALEARLPAATAEEVMGPLMGYYGAQVIPNDAITGALTAALKILGGYLDALPHLVIEKEVPELVDIEPVTDDQFAAGIDGDKLEIAYSIKNTEKYPLQYAKLEVYKNDGTLVYLNNENIGIGEGKKFQWDGKMNQGNDAEKYIRYDDGEFTVKILASIEEEFNNPFEASTTARVDINADKWRDFDHQDIGVPSAYWSFETFKSLKKEYKKSLKEISDEHPLDYLNESLVPIKFLGQGPFMLNIRFGYVLKLFEQSLPASKRSEYASYLNTVSFDSKLRMTPLGSVVSNHSLGFALDLNAPENPMIIDPFIYHFIEFVTGVKSFYERRERTNAFIDELKNTHNTFINRLNLKSGNAVTWESLIGSAEKIEVFENRESDSETSPLYFLSDAAGNIPLNDLEVIRVSIENLNDADITEEQISEACNNALARLVLIETQITSLQSIVTEYEEGMLRKYFVPEELIALKEYLTMTAEQIESNRTSINELKEYIALNNVEQLFQDFLNYLNGLFEGEEEQDSFSKMAELNNLNDHVIEVYNGFKSLESSLDTYKKYLEKIKGKVNQASSVTGKKLMEQGFFNLSSDFIKDWFAIDYSYWGGFYDDNHDFMHLEVVNTYKQKALKRLHDRDLSFYKDFFEDNYPEEYAEMFNE